MEHTPKEEEIRAKFKKQFDGYWRGEAIPDEICNFWLKIRREAIAEERERVRKAIESISYEVQGDDFYDGGETEMVCKVKDINLILTQE